MKKLIPILLFALAVLITNSCRRDKYIPNVCFKENILPIFITRCAMPGCHSTTNKYNFTSYDGIMKGVSAGHLSQSEIYGKIKGPNPEMPPKGSTPLTPTEIANIKYWINFGAQNTSCGTATTAVSNCDTSSTLTYNNAISAIMNTGNCLGCHPNFSNFTGVSSDAFNILARVKLPATNALHMPQGGVLSACEIAKIEKWINLGKPQ